MKTPEEILKELQKENPTSIPTFKAMEAYAKQEAIAFSEFIANHPLDFQPSFKGGFIGIDIEHYATSYLYELFQQSKTKT